MTMEFDYWNQWGLHSGTSPIVLPGYRKRIRNGVPALQKSRFLGELGHDGIASDPALVAAGALRLARAGRANMIPEPLRSVVLQTLRAARNRKETAAALGAIDFGGSSMIKTPLVSDVLVRAAEEVQKREPEIAEKMAAQAPPIETPGVVTPDEIAASKDYQPVALVEPLSQSRTGLVYNTRTGLSPEAEALLEQQKQQGIVSSQAVGEKSREQEALEVQAGQALKQAFQQGLITQPQFEAVKMGISDAVKSGQALTPELVAQEVTKQQLGQGVTQATGGGGAASSGGSMFGIGLGGPAFGTGTIGGAVGQALANLFGTPGLPAGVRVDGRGGLYATPFLTDNSWLNAAGMLDRLGSGITGAVLGPGIHDIRAGIENLYLDARAREAAEWREKTRAFRREVLRLLWALYDQHIQAGYPGTLGRRY